MSLLMIAEILAGEAVVTPGGAVDLLTACAGEPQLWSLPSGHLFERTGVAGSVDVLATAGV